jgi:hypothetical protein
MLKLNNKREEAFMDKRKKCFIKGLWVLCLIFPMLLQAQHGIVWVNRYHGGYGDDEVRDMVVDDSGNIYVTGSIPPYRILTIKYNAQGETLWARTYHDYSGSRYGNAIAVDDSGNVYVTGHSWANPNPVTVTIKYDRFGNQKWVKTYDPGAYYGTPPNTAGTDIAVDKMGNVYVTGYAAYDFQTDYFLNFYIKYDTSGNKLWDKRFITYRRLQFDVNKRHALSLDSMGNGYLSHLTLVYDNGWRYAVKTVKVDSSGNTLWEHTYNPNVTVADNALDGQGNLYVLARSYSMPGGYATHLVKYNCSTGAYQVIFTAYDREAIGLTIDGSNVYVASQNSGNGAFTIYKFNSQGQMIWSHQRSFPIGASVAPSHIAIGNIRNSVNVYVTGTVRLQSNLPTDYFIIKFIDRGTSAHESWCRFYNGPANGNDGAARVAFSKKDSLVCITGTSQGIGTGNDIATLKMRPFLDVYVTINGQGTVTKTPGLDEYPLGYPETSNIWVVLDAQPAEGWHFVNYSGDLQSDNSYDSIFVDGDKSVTATFELNTYNLNLTIIGEGQVELDPPQGPYPHGTWVKLTAIPDEGYHFVGYSGDLQSTNAYDSIRMTSDKSVTATFELNTYNLNLTINGEGQVELNPSQGPYPHGTWVKLTAIPDEGYHFVGYSGDLQSTNAYDSIRMTSDKSVTAIFEINMYDLEVFVVGNGAVTLEPEGGLYPHGTWVKLSATPTAEGWYFVRYSGDLISGNPYDSILMNRDMTVTATFSDQYNLTIHIVGRGNVYKDPQQPTYSYGTWVRLTAQPHFGHLFNEWTGDLTGCSSLDSVLINENKTVTAHFTAGPPGWVRVKDLPKPLDINKPTQRRVKYAKDGGSLTATNDAIYAFPGNRSWQFYKYLPAEDSWEIKESIPYGPKYDPTTGLVDTTRFNKRKVGRGASLCWDGGNYIYATKGNNTYEFWKYDIAQDSWILLPYAKTTRPLKNGTSLAYHNGYIYLLAGGQKQTLHNFFFRYSIEGDSWEILNNPQIGIKDWKAGSAIVSFRNKIYAMKGGERPNYFLRFDPMAKSWDVEHDTLVIPESLWTGKKWRVKKIYLKNGGALVNAGDEALYMIKGGGIHNFYRYTPENRWQQLILDTIPRVGLKPKVSVPKEGAALTYYEPYVYLMKGNNTPEFWRYHTLVRNQRDRAGSSVISSDMSSGFKNQMVNVVNVVPNLIIRRASVRYVVPTAGRVSLKLYDATGRAVRTLSEGIHEAGVYTLALNTEQLARGVYFLRYETSDEKLEVKIIVE